MRRGHWGHVGSPSSSAFALSRTSRSSGAIPGGLQVQAIDGIDDDAPDQGPEGVLVVRRHHEPRCPWGRRGTQRLLVGELIGIPMLALGQVTGLELPTLVGMVQSLEEPLLLLVARHVQEDLHHPGPVPIEMVLEGIDVLVAVVPQLCAGVSR